MKHTPGPWAVYDPKEEGSTFGIDSAGGPAVVFYGRTERDGIRRIEDARLIAAAPDLLEALRDLVSQLEEHDERDREPECPVCGAVADARAAIAKATGGVA